MTELDVRQNGHAAPYVQQHTDAESEMARWAADVQQVYIVAQSLAKTSFVPQSMRGKPEEVCAAILTGGEVGLKQMASLRSIDIIQGTPAMRALTMRALVLAAGHEIWTKEESDTRVVVEGRRRGSEHVERSAWSMDRAAKLGLTGKDNWKKQPGVMLHARATAEVCRKVAADVLMGLPYAIEELDNGPAEATEDGAPRTIRRRKPAEPAPEPERPPLPETVVDTTTGEIQVEDTPADALIEEPPGW